MLELPEHLKPTREFKSKKRTQLREAVKALRECRLGCAFMPSGREVVRALKLTEDAIEKCSVKNWGR